MSLLEDIDYSSLPDEELFTLSLKRPQLFALIVRRYEAAFLRKAESVLKSREAAEDATQETFTKIYFKAKYFESRGEGSFKSWGYKILMNTTFTHYQKLRRGNVVQLPEEFEEFLPDLGGIAFQEQKELADYIASIFVKMPDSMASVLNKFFLEGKSQEEIAEEEGVTVGSVKTRVYRAKEVFRSLLGSHPL
jgi:RNA polymerase sigma-70 factor (ECF subfamily)